jgi:hypothetical protein
MHITNSQLIKINNIKYAHALWVNKCIIINTFINNHKHTQLNSIKNAGTPITLSSHDMFRPHKHNFW